MAETPLFGGGRLQMHAPTLDKCQRVKKMWNLDFAEKCIKFVVRI